MKVQLITGIIFKKKSTLAAARRALLRTFGPLAYESPVVDFDFTDYYYPQMGKPLYRVFFGFKKLVREDALASIKSYTNRLEALLSRRAARTRPLRAINIDPGYITSAKLVLASTKDFSHRIYLSRGIYAEVTLQFRKKGIVFFDWTFPDYKSPRYQKILLALRQRYLEVVRKNKAIHGA